MKKNIIALITIVLVLSMTVGCSGIYQKGDVTKSAVAIVLGAHAQSRSLNLSSPIVRDAVTQAIENFGHISVISNDGSPELVAAANYYIPEHQRGNPQLLRDIANEQAVSLLAGMAEVRADDDEVDTLSSLNLAVRTLASAPPDAEKTILVIDPGLPTSGLLNFSNNLIGAEPQAIADALFEIQAIPDFSNISVLWMQMGDLYGSQERLSPAQFQRLQEIWRAIIERTGGHFEISLTVPNPGGVGGNLPRVSLVDLAVEKPIVFSETIQNDYDRVIIFTEEQVRFVADSAEFQNHGDAVDAISVVADDMREDPALKIVLIGTTAGDESTDFTYDLSRRRAEAVRDALVSLGIADNRIRAVGMAASNPWHIANAGTSGKLAAQNRRVVIISADSQIAIELFGENGYTRPIEEGGETQ